MPTYIISGQTPSELNLAHLIYPPPYHYHIDISIPHPKRDYTVIFTLGWRTHPLIHTPSLATLVLDAKVVETTAPITSFYTGRPCAFCQHVPHTPTTTILRSESGYLFLCPSCVATYAIHGLPELPNLIFKTLYRNDTLFSGTFNENSNPGNDIG